MTSLYHGVGEKEPGAARRAVVVFLLNTDIHATRRTAAPLLDPPLGVSGGPFGDDRLCADHTLDRRGLLH